MFVRGKMRLLLKAYAKSDISGLAAYPRENVEV